VSKILRDPSHAWSWSNQGLDRQNRYLGEDLVDGAEDDAHRLVRELEEPGGPSQGTLAAGELTQGQRQRQTVGAQVPHQPVPQVRGQAGVKQQLRAQQVVRLIQGVLVQGRGGPFH